MPDRLRVVEKTNDQAIQDSGMIGVTGKVRLAHPAHTLGGANVTMESENEARSNSAPT